MVNAPDASGSRNSADAVVAHALGELHCLLMRSARASAIAAGARRIVIALIPALSRPCRLRLHPGIARGIGVHARATVIDGSGAQFVVPGFVAVDLAKPVLGAVLGQPSRGIEGPDVDRVPRFVSGCAWGCHPLGSFLCRPVLRDCLTEQLFLVFPGTPAAGDEHLDLVAGGIGCSSAQGAEQIGVEVRYTRNLVIKDRHAVGEDTVSLAKRTTLLRAKNHRAVRDGTGSLAERARGLTATDGDA